LDAERQPMLRAGDVLADKYSIEGLLGCGGMGTVYAARNLELGLRVAIKVAHHSSSRAYARLVREARISALLANHHIPRTFDLGRFPNGAPYIVMEHLDGEDLAHVIARGPVSAHDGVDYVRQACAALSHAHAAGIVHRDLKPANLFLTKRNATGPAVIKVLDFGISKRLDVSKPTDRAITSPHFGSPLYMSPEQIRANKHLDERTDIWSLGVIFYELLTGKPPFGGSTLYALSVAIATDAPRPLSHWRSDLPPGLERVVLRCLEKDPAARFGSAKELMRVMKTFAFDAHPRSMGRLAKTAKSAHASIPNERRLGERVAKDA
jgi:serine/threonine protein kinase